MRTFSRAALVLLLLVLSACDSNDDESDDVLGTYSLVSVGGQSLPATINSEGTYESGFVRLEESRVIANVVIVESSGGTTSRFESEVGGTYTLDGETLRLRLTNEDGRVEISTGTLRDNTIAIAAEDLTLVFRK